jgi:hypothetical protein
VKEGSSYISGWVILPCRRSWKLGTRLKVLRAMFSIEEDSSRRTAGKEGDNKRVGERGKWESGRIQDRGNRGCG